MNYQLLSRFLGILALLIGGFMLLSLIWAFPELGYRTDEALHSTRFERDGFVGLLISTLISWAVGGLLYLMGRGAPSGIFRREAMAIVGLGWIMATVLGALPFLLSGTCARPSLKIVGDLESIYTPSNRWELWKRWDLQSGIELPQKQILGALLAAGPRGVSEHDLVTSTGNPAAFRILGEMARSQPWSDVVFLPGEGSAETPSDRSSHCRIQWVAVGPVDAMFESQSGFSTTGATILSELNDSWLVPHCILFWRASTHFLGGIGIIVLFVVILGQGAAGKALMRAEMPGPSKEGSTARMQHTAWMFGGVYLVLNFVLAAILMLLGVSLFDALCHSFATMATGGFSTYTASVAHFEHLPQVNAVMIETVITVFMFLAGGNFLLLFLVVIGQWKIPLADAEFRLYPVIVLVLSLLIIATGCYLGDPGFGDVVNAIRITLFQVVSIQTTTGFVTADFDQWNSFSRLLLVLTMFIGGCSGATAGGIKVIRFVLLVKILRIELEHSYHPNVVRLLRMGGKAVDDQELRRSILVYFVVLSILFVLGWIFVVALEPSTTWGEHADNKLIDSATAVVTTLNNIGPGLGVVGATQSFSEFCGINKLMFIFLMMVGRLEIFPVLVLFLPGFWRDQ